MPRQPKRERYDLRYSNVFCSCIDRVKVRLYDEYQDEEEEVKEPRRRENRQKQVSEATLAVDAQCDPAAEQRRDCAEHRKPEADVERRDRAIGTSPEEEKHHRGGDQRVDAAENAEEDHLPRYTREQPFTAPPRR